VEICFDDLAGIAGFEAGSVKGIGADGAVSLPFPLFKEDVSLPRPGMPAVKVDV